MKYGILLLLILAAMVYFRVMPLPAPLDDATRQNMASKGPGAHKADGSHLAIVPTLEIDRAKLEAAIAATPRTKPLGAGRYVSRSWIWGFPDVATIWEADGHLLIHSSLVIGKADLGVNRRRVEAWLEAARVSG